MMYVRVTDLPTLITIAMQNQHLFVRLLQFVGKVSASDDHGTALKRQCIRLPNDMLKVLELRRRELLVTISGPV